MNPADVIDFWAIAGESRWFTRDAAFDGQLSVRFRSALARGREGEFDHWAETPQGVLGLVILLDQFSRNIHRGNPLMFAADAKALAIARQAVGRGFHQRMPASVSRWLIMPFEHAEDIDAQWRGVGLFEAMGLIEMSYWAKIHLDIIRKFRRFPHRNPILGRPSTAEELTFLAHGGFAG
jgi:uncharacterized protein (DUF924 family)